MKKIDTKKISRNKNKGVASLATVMVIGMMIVAIVVSITSVAFNELFISQGVAQSSSALFYAESGARDALLKIARNKTYVCSPTNSCNGVGYYLINMVTNGCTNSTGCAQVVVSSGVGTTASPKIITSTGVSGLSTRRVQVNVTLDGGASSPDSALVGEMTTVTWQELTN